MPCKNILGYASSAGIILLNTPNIYNIHANALIPIINWPNQYLIVSFQKIFKPINIIAIIAGVDSQRASFGSALNRLNMSIANLSNAKINAEASRARVMDTDYAAETAELARTQIIAQAGIAMLSQANAIPNQVLQLLQ